MSAETSATASRGARLDDRERALAERLRLLGLDRLDGRERRRLGGEPGEEPLDGVRVALGLELDTTLVVQDPAAEAELLGEAEDVGTKADPLDDAGDPRPHAPAPGARHDHPGASSISSRSTW